jgi:hypothetical protein
MRIGAASKLQQLKTHRHSKTFQELQKLAPVGNSHGDAREKYELGKLFCTGVETKADSQCARFLLQGAAHSGVNEKPDYLQWMLTTLYFQTSLLDARVPVEVGNLWLGATQVQASNLGVREFDPAVRFCVVL